jgi:DNA-directed RNA polymerase specialized sigma24 family protein
LSAESYQKLLGVLDPDDPARAARNYDRVRRRLIRLFEWRGARFPEDLADETMTRVARRLAEGVEIRSEDPFRYFCGVAHMVFKEELREARKWQEGELVEQTGIDPRAEEPEDDRMVILQECMGALPDDHQRLILDYHEGEKRRRIENRRRIAQGLGIPLNALRIRILRIRGKLEKCVQRKAAELT